MPHVTIECYPLNRAITLSAALAMSAIVALLLMFLLAGIGQDPLQFAQSPEVYAGILSRNPPLLRLVIGLDNAFIVFYWTMFAALGTRLAKDGAARGLVIAATGLLSLTALLDLLENMHFLAMIGMVGKGATIAAPEITIQITESLLKFHASYVGLFMLSFVLPAGTRLENLLAFLLRWVHWPIGIAIYAGPEWLTKPLVLVRFALFLASLMLIFLIYSRREAD